MTASYQVRAGTANVNGLEFGLLEAGSGPLALCMHGFPDNAHTWGRLLPVLAKAGFHAVAPFMRGYAPTAVPADGAYHVGTLAADAVALHEALGGESDAVLIGHDWGAEAAYAAAAYAPGRWRRLVTLAVPPAALDPVLFSDYDQLRRFFYLFVFRDPAGGAEAVVAADGMAFIDRLWADWSPGYRPGEHLARVKDSLRHPANLAAAIGYYRAAGASGQATDSPDGVQYAAEQQATGRQAPQPTLYLHGADDGCIAADLARGAAPLLAPSSRMTVIGGAGHFLHLEKPDEVNNHILAWVTS
ncbi:MAG: alpha/beta hydrolase [Nocardiopsaceae bacterium]|nr:alpha/beta hydrolase [Nocardiopsaceae bacterium]